VETKRDTDHKMPLPSAMSFGSPWRRTWYLWVPRADALLPCPAWSLATDGTSGKPIPRGGNYSPL